MPVLESGALLHFGRSRRTAVWRLLEPLKIALHTVGASLAVRFLAIARELRAYNNALLQQSFHSHRMPKETPEGKRLQLIVCSATLHSPEVKKFAEELMYYPTWIDLKVGDEQQKTTSPAASPLPMLQCIDMPKFIFFSSLGRRQCTRNRASNCRPSGSGPRLVRICIDLNSPSPALLSVASHNVLLTAGDISLSS